MMQSLMRKIFDLYPGESRKVVLFCLLALVWSSGSYGTMILSESLLVQEAGSQALPLCYCLIAICLFTFSLSMIYCLNHLPITKILSIILAFSILLQLFFLCSYPFFSHVDAFWIAFRTFGWIMPVTIYISFWAFVDQYFDLQSAKRVFALFNAMCFLGDAIGCGILNLFLDSITFRGVLAIFMAIVSLSLFLVPYIQRTVITKKELDCIPTPKPISVKSLLNTMLTSRYTLGLILFYFCMQVLAILTEFGYLGEIEVHSKNPDSPFSLPAKLSFANIWISIGNMLFGIFFYSRMVKKLGVNNLIVIAPLVFMVLYFFWLPSQALMIGMVAMVIREGIVYSLDDNNLNLLLSGVPTKIKNQVRFGVEAFFEPAGMLTTALLLFFVQRDTKFLGLILSIFAVVFVLILRFLYSKAIFKNLISTHLNIKAKPMDWFKELRAKERKKMQYVLLSNLKYGKESEKLIAFQYLVGMHEKWVLPHLLNQMGTLSLPGKHQAFEMLFESSWAKEPIILNKVKLWSQRTPHLSLKVTLQLYQAYIKPYSEVQMQLALASQDLSLQAAALISRHRYEINTTLTQALDTIFWKFLYSQTESEKILALRIMGLSEKESMASYLIKSLNDPSAKVVRQASISLSRIITTEYSIDPTAILGKIRESTDILVQRKLLEALAPLMNIALIPALLRLADRLRQIEKYLIIDMVEKLGAQAVPSLCLILKANSEKEATRLLAAKALKELNIQQLQKEVENLLPLLTQKIFFYFYHAHRIQYPLPEHNLLFLRGALFSRFESLLDFLIQLLTLKSGYEECEVMVRSIKSSNLKIKAAALETLEKMTSFRSWNKIKLFFVHHTSLEETLNFYLKKGYCPLNLSQLLHVLLESAHPIDRLIAQTVNVQLTPDGKNLMKNEENETIFQNYATDLTQTGEKLCNPRS